MEFVASTLLSGDCSQAARNGRSCREGCRVAAGHPGAQMPDLNTDQLISLLDHALSLVTFVVGWVIGAWRERRRFDRDREETCRRFTTFIGPVLSELRSKRDHFGRVERGTRNLEDYFKNEFPLLKDEERGSLSGLDDAGEILDQRCHDSWHGAIASIRAADDLHDQAREEVVLTTGAQPNVDGGVYRRTLDEAIEATTDALEEAQRFASDDTVERIDTLLTT